MIEFRVVSNKKKLNRIPKSYPKLIEYEVDFAIVVDGEVFFYEPNFPLLEFMSSVKGWKELGDGSFEYISIETEDNPLISFIKEEGFWRICSPWQLFKCETKFTKEELVNALDVLGKTI